MLSVKTDILLQLGLHPKTKIFTTLFFRSNLVYEVRFKPPDNDPFPDIISFLEKMYLRRGKRLGNTNRERAKGVCGIM